MKVKAHKRYRNKDDVLIPGVTTICNLMGKPFLIKWANKLGLEGIDSAKFVDNLADIGTLAHARIECRLTGEELDTSDYDENQIMASVIPFEKYIEWEKENDFKLIESELSLSSDKYGYGGTCDIYCMLNGKKTLIDVKTSKSIYDSHYIQLSAYRQLLVENGYEVEDTRILRIGRIKNEGFACIQAPYLEEYWQIFYHLLHIYGLKKRIG